MIFCKYLDIVLIAGLYQNIFASGIKKLPLIHIDKLFKKLTPFFFDKKPGLIFSSFFPVKILYNEKGSQIFELITSIPSGTSYNKLSSYKEIMIEKYIPGREIQVAIMGKRKLGAIELVPKRKFYDYQAKYDIKAKTKHIIPVKINKNKIKEVLNIASKAHKIIACKGVTRSDFKFYNNKFYLLEINTQPGMTSLSLVPEIAKFNNISFSNLIEWIIKDASIQR